VALLRATPPPTTPPPAQEADDVPAEENQSPAPLGQLSVLFESFSTMFNGQVLEDLFGFVLDLLSKFWDAANFLQNI
jgi:hypothetical protein